MTITPDTLDISTARWERLNADVDCDVLAKQMLAELSPADIEPVLTRLLADQLVHLRRRRVRDAEERAARARHGVERRDDDRDKLAPWKAPRGSRTAREWARLDRTEQNRRRAALDPAFARYLGQGGDTADGSLAFASWQLSDALEQLRQSTRQEVLLDLTTELLESEFALGDGCSVTWGDATSAQHMQRFDLLMTNASGSLQAAQRHAAAVRLLDEHGVNGLREVRR